MSHSGCKESRTKSAGPDGGTPPDSTAPTDGQVRTDGGTGPDGGTACNCANPHPAWLLCEDFEAGGGDFDTWFAGSEFNDSVGTGDRGRIDLSSEHVRSGPADS